MGIEDILAERGKLVDRLIEKYLPKKYDEKALEFTLGKARYSHSAAAADKAIAQPVWELLSRGGKRWRPVLFLLTCEALGGDAKKYEDISVMFELIHDGSLIIDDIEDSSELRRGKKAIHKIFGEDIAINAGNSIYYIPLLALLRNREKFSKDTLLKIYETYSQELINIHFGQAMDIVWHRGLASPSEAEYLQMCAYKTGTLARLAAKTGAIVAGADEKAEKIGALAEALGIGFQIQDDVLNLTAVSRNQFTAAYRGSDITEGKRSLVVIHTLEKADAKDRKRLLEILDNHTAEREKIDEAIGIIRKYGSLEYASQRGKEIVSEAWQEAEKLLKENAAKKDLKALVDFCLTRGW